VIKPYILCLIDTHFFRLNVKHRTSLLHLLSQRSNYQFEFWERMIPLIRDGPNEGPSQTSKGNKPLGKGTWTWKGDAKIR
jgi:hypothetical protein